VYGAFTLYGRPFQCPSTSTQICNSPGPLTQSLSRLTTPIMQRCQPITHDRFGLFPFRSPLLREYMSVSFPEGTEMFQFPSYSPPSLCVQLGGAWALPQTGFPIRISPDITPDDGSPRLFAAIHVLLRLLAPRHPPCALSSLIQREQLEDARILFSF
jgi:hypothetical protein